MKNGLKVMDCDLHVIEGGEVYDKFFTGPHRTAKPKYLGWSPTNFPHWDVQGRMIPPWAHDANVIGPQLIRGAMDVPVVVTVEAGLSFLGLGVLPPTASWGTILNEGYLIIRDTPWPVIAGGIPLVLTTLGFTFLGEALRDVFDPKLRKGR